LGLALLLPWNVFITASEFFRVKFAGSPYQMNFQNWFSTSYTLTNLVVIAVCISQQHRIKPRPVILITLAVNVVIFMCMTIFTRIASLQGTTFFGLTLAMLTLGAMSSSLMQCALFALVSRFPPLYIQGVLSGQAVAGVVVSIVQLVTAASTLRSQDQLRAFAYFLIASVVCILVLGLFVVLQRLPFYRHFLPKDSQNSSAPPFRDNWHLVKATARSIPSLIFTIALLFAVTFSVFPALTAAVQPLNFARIPFVEIHFVLFNIGDWTGRWFSMFPWLRFLNSRVVLFGALSHLVFVPLFLFSNSVFPATVTRLVPVLIRSDIAFFVIVALFGISNGYWGSLAMMTGPQVALDKERAGTVMSFFLVFGMAFGSVLSFGVTAL
ncbi:nucleoside transporter-domain-containing protein, partial [Dimargaris cristalligena]